MNTAITPYQRTESLPSHGRPMEMSGALAHFVNGDWAQRHYLTSQGNPSLREAEEARRVLERVDHICRRAPVQQIGTWMAKFARLPRAPSSEDEAKRATADVAFANQDLPVAVWTAETAAEGLRTFKWHPTPAEVRALLEPHAKLFWRQRDGLRRVIDFVLPSPESVEAKTPEAVAHVADIVAAFAKERSFNQPDAARDTDKKVRAMALSDGLLLAEYDKVASEDGPFSAAAATRAAAIRRRLNAPTLGAA